MMGMSIVGPTVLRWPVVGSGIVGSRQERLSRCGAYYLLLLVMPVITKDKIKAYFIEKLEYLL